LVSVSKTPKPKKSRNQWKSLDVVNASVLPLAGILTVPVRIGDWDVPSAFKIQYIFESSTNYPGMYWAVEFTINVSAGGIVSSQEIVLKGANRYLGDNGTLHAADKEYPIEEFQLRKIMTNLRRLEALAIRVVVQTYVPEPQSENLIKWIDIRGSDFTDEELDSLERKVRNRTRYTKTNDYLMEFIVSTCKKETQEAKRQERLPKYASVIETEYQIKFPDMPEPSRKTVERWIRETRKVFPNRMPPPKKNSARKKLVGKADPSKKKSTSAQSRKGM